VVLTVLHVVLTVLHVFLTVFHVVLTVLYVVLAVLYSDLTSEDEEVLERLAQQEQKYQPLLPTLVALAQVGRRAGGPDCLT